MPFTSNELHYGMQAGASLLVCRVFAVDVAHNFLHDCALSSSINADLGVRSPTPYKYIHSNMPAQKVLQEAGLPGHAGLQAFCCNDDELLLILCKLAYGFGRHLE